jgi:hypothetical protein
MTTRATRTTAAEVESLYDEAWKAHWKGDLDTAETQALDTLDALNRIDAGPLEIAEMTHKLAGLFRKLNDREHCEELALRAIEAETRLGRQSLLGNHQLFYAMFLSSCGRYAEAAHYALRALPNLEAALRGVDDKELAVLRLEVKKIVDEAERNLKS